MPGRLYPRRGLGVSARRIRSALSPQRLSTGVRRAGTFARVHSDILENQNLWVISNAPPRRFGILVHFGVCGIHQATKECVNSCATGTEFCLVACLIPDPSRVFAFLLVRAVTVHDPRLRMLSKLVLVGGDRHLC